MKTYGIYDAHDPREPIRKIRAENVRAALASYSVSFGYADPRESGEEFFSVLFDGTTSMVIENKEVYAVHEPGHGEEELEAASLSGWKKLSSGKTLTELEPEELYAVYCEVTEAAQQVGVAV